MIAFAGGALVGGALVGVAGMVWVLRNVRPWL